MMALALFRFSQLLFPLLLLVFLRPPPIPKLDDKKEAREGFFLFPVPCRHSAFPVYVRKKGGKEIRMGEKAPQRYGRRRRRRRRTAEEGQKYAEIKKGESEAPLLPYPPPHSKQQWGIAIVFSPLPTDAFLFFFFCLPPILQLEIYGEGGDVDVGPSLPSSASSSSVSFDSRQWKKKWWSGEVWAGPGPTFSERGKVSCSVRRRNLDNLFYKVQ